MFWDRLRTPRPTYKLKSIPAVIGQDVGYSLNRANTTMDNHPHSHAVNLESLIKPTHVLKCGSWSTCSESTHMGRTLYNQSRY